MIDGKKNKSKLLIVDDVESLRELMVDEFRYAGHQVFQASNIKDAFKIITENEIDIVLSDYNMPGGNGIELLKKIKEYDHKIQVLIFVSVCEISLEEAINAGACNMLTKPVDIRYLLASIEQLTMKPSERWKKEKQNFSIKHQLKCQFKNWDDAFQQQKLQLGSGGLTMHIDIRVQTDDYLHFDIIFNDHSPPMIGVGQIRWSKTVDDSPPQRHHIGIEFVHLEEESINHVVEVIERKRIRPYIPKAA